MARRRGGGGRENEWCEMLSIQNSDEEEYLDSHTKESGEEAEKQRKREKEKNKGREGGRKRGRETDREVKMRSSIV